MNKKLLATLIAATFAAPVAVYAEEDDGPTLYGRLHLGIEHSDTDADGSSLDVRSNSSRFGIKGDTDLGNGLNVFYQYEFGVDADTANIINNNRVARVGFGGSFGKIALGRQWSAMFNHVGTFMDITQAIGTSGTTYRVSNDLQYSVSAGPVNLQADLILDGANGASDGLDRFQLAGSGKFGIFSIGLGYQQTAEATGIIEAIDPIDSRAKSEAYDDLTMSNDFTVALNTLRTTATDATADAMADAMAADTMAAAADTANADAADATAAANADPTDTALQTDATAARVAATAAREAATMARETATMAEAGAELAKTHLAEFTAAGSNTVTGAPIAPIPGVAAVAAQDSSQIGIGAGVEFGNFFIKGGYVSKEFDLSTKPDETTTVLNIGASSDNGLSGFVSFGEQGPDGAENDFIIGQVRKDIGGGTQVYIEARNDDDYNGKGEERTRVLLAMRKDF